MGLRIRIKSLMVLLLSAVPMMCAQTTTWTPNKAHSEVDFSILHMSVSNVRGRFGNIDGAIDMNQADITKSTIDVTIDVSSIDTGLGARDSVLKSSSFFDVAQFPKATFVSNSITKTGSGLEVTGNLTLHGVTRPIVLEVEGPNGPVLGMDHKPHCGFSAKGTINRTDFGIGNAYPAGLVGSEVKITIDLDAARQ
jgi:polyisoprenoid-binding protein YceI